MTDHDHADKSWLRPDPPDFLLTVLAVALFVALLCEINSRWL